MRTKCLLKRGSEITVFIVSWLLLNLKCLLALMNEVKVKIFIRQHQRKNNNFTWMLTQNYLFFEPLTSSSLYLRTKGILVRWWAWSNISKTSASVSSGVPNTEKVIKARGRRPSAFIVSRCLEPLMKHEARVFDMASQMKQ